MAGHSTAPTSPTLLGRLGRVPADHDAWAEFAGRYGRKIYGWCRRRAGRGPRRSRARRGA